MGGPYKGISYSVSYDGRGFEVAMNETSNMTSSSRQCKAEVDDRGGCIHGLRAKSSSHGSSDGEVIMA